jgi:hypothetical protein
MVVVFWFVKCNKGNIFVFSKLIYYIIKTTNNQRFRLARDNQIENNGQDQLLNVRPVPI